MDGVSAFDVDRAIAVDWSAASRPSLGANSIWIGVAGRDMVTAVENMATRRAAERSLAAHVDDAIAARERVLIGCDAGLGYPEGSGAAFQPVGIEQGRSSEIDPWRATWTLLESALVDDDANRNNRFEVAAALNHNAQNQGISAGPFWGAPDSAVGPTLTRTKPGRPSDEFTLDEYRLTERELRAGGRRPHSMWQLMGAGSVGSQSLTLIPVLERLRRAHPDAVAVWPFEHGRVQSGAASVVIAEMWPTMFGFDDVIASRLCRDAAQVHRMAEVALASGGGWLDVPHDVPDAVVTEEGWVLGVAWPEVDDPTPDSAATR